MTTRPPSGNSPTMNNRNSGGASSPGSRTSSPKPSQLSKDAGKYDILMKVILIGDSGVGKSCLLMRFSEDTFNQSFINTVGIDFKIKSIVVDDKIVKLQIYDTAGQERFRTITAAYYRGAQGVMLVYDVTDPSSFRNIRDWVAGMMAHVDPGCRMIIVGNKCDLDDRREVPEVKGSTLATEFGFKFIETSAKTNLNVEDAFNILVREIKIRMDRDKEDAISGGKKTEQPTVGLEDTTDKKQKSGCRCGGSK